MIMETQINVAWDRAPWHPQHHWQWCSGLKKPFRRRLTNKQKKPTKLCWCGGTYWILPFVQRHWRTWLDSGQPPESLKYRETTIMRTSAVETFIGQYILLTTQLKGRLNWWAYNRFSQLPSQLSVDAHAICELIFLSLYCIFSIFYVY